MSQNLNKNFCRFLTGAYFASVCLGTFSFQNNAFGGVVADRQAQLLSHLPPGHPLKPHATAPHPTALHPKTPAHPTVAKAPDAKYGEHATSASRLDAAHNNGEFKEVSVSGKKAAIEAKTAHNTSDHDDAHHEVAEEAHHDHAPAAPRSKRGLSTGAKVGMGVVAVGAAAALAVGIAALVETQKAQQQANQAKTNSQGDPSMTTAAKAVSGAVDQKTATINEHRAPWNNATKDDSKSLTP